MPTIIYYRQARRDGCIRTGIELDDLVLLGRFEGETDDPDPVLSWYVNVESVGEDLPGEPEAIRRWLLDHGQPIRHGLEAVAEGIDAGLDLQDGLRREIPVAVGVVTTLYCRGNRRAESQHMAEILRDIALHWMSRIRDLPAILPATL
jgi:hypothetical protein